MLRPNAKQWAVLWSACAWTVAALVIAEDYVFRAVFGGWLVGALAYWQLAGTPRASAVELPAPNRESVFWPWWTLGGVFAFPLILSVSGSSDTQAVGLLAGFICWYVLSGVCLVTVAKALRIERTWRAWVPLFYLTLLADAARVSQAWVLACLVGLSVIFVPWMWLRIFGRLRMHWGWALLVCIPILNAPLLAYIAAHPPASPPPLPSQDDLQPMGSSGTETPARGSEVSRRLVYLSAIFAGLSALAIVYTSSAARPFGFLMKAQEPVEPHLLSSVVVAVRCESTRDGSESTGSGILLSSAGLVLTNSHVIPQDESSLHTLKEGCVVVLPDGKTGSPIEAYWARPIVIPGIAEEYDLAHLQIEAAYTDEQKTYGTWPKSLPALYDDQGDYFRTCGFEPTAVLGDQVRLFGYPAAGGGFRLTVTEGIVSGFTDGGLMTTSAKIDSGNSGGLAVNDLGCMVGVPSAILRGEFDNLGVLIPTQLIRQFDKKFAEATQ